MKKQLLALSLLTASGLMADACCPQPCCPTPCCEPCCIPQPRKCINCECYNPQYYMLQCDWGVFVTVDFLYWYSRETNLEFAEKFQMISSFSSGSSTGGATPKSFANPTEYFHLKAPWEPGVRVGFGWNMNCDGWDLFLNWTYFHASQSNKASADFVVESRNGEFGIFNPWISGLLKTNDFNEVHARWSICFNQIDLELGKKYWVSRCFTLRPYAGIRGAWTKTHFDVKDKIFPGPAPGIVSFEEIDRDHFINRFWGAGLLGGLQPEWRLGSWCGCGEFSIYGNAEVAAIWGEFKGRRSSDGAFAELDEDGTAFTFEDTQLVFSSHEKVFQMVGIIDLALGLRWEDYWCCDRYRTEIDLGWEHHYWINHGLRHQSNVAFTDEATFPDQTLQFYSNTNSIVSDLVFGGFVLRARFDF